MPADAKHARKLSARQVRKIAREKFLRARKLEKQYERQLTVIGKYVGNLIKGFAPDGVVTNMPALQTVLEKYSESLQPWAYAVSHRMQQQVAQRNALAWQQLGSEIGRSLRLEIEKAPTGELMKRKLAEQVDLITSLPRKAGQRVHKLTLQALEDSSRASEIQKEILRSGHVTVGRAKLIGRTEVGRTASVLTEARARHVGSEGYIWRTSKDSDVRDLHRHLEGKFVRWDDPPIAGERGERAHAGAIYYCRCYPEVVVPDVVGVAA